jgi:hypothetical protein
MLPLAPLQAVDYLLLGHIAMDITPDGLRLGGTVAYAGLTARAMGLSVGVVTSCGPKASLDTLSGISIVSIPAKHSTTFENIKTENGRKQILHHCAEPIRLEHIPEPWRNTPMIHLAPIARELDGELSGQFPESFVGITPQGWMRTWDENGRVAATAWEESEHALRHAGAVVFSTDDVNRNLEQVEALAHQTRILCLTEAEAGSVLYWNGDRRRFRAPAMREVDATGAGDIFAAGFFIRLHATRDPWEAARFATQLAARSVARVGLDGIPTQKEIDECLVEVLS